MQRRNERELKMAVGVYLFAAILILFQPGCESISKISGAPSAPAPEVVYKYDLRGSVNGMRFDGIGVFPKAPFYDMRIESRVDVDLFTVTSCHRDFSVESAIKIGWFEDKKGYSYRYNPTPGIEDLSSCLVKLGSFNRDKGQSAWGLIDFRTDDATLPAMNYCNGASGQTGGTSFCQSRAGLIQRLVFDVEVAVDASNLKSACVPSTKDNKTWEYQIALGECVIAFMEKAVPNRVHRHTTVGYNQILIRGN